MYLCSYAWYVVLEEHMEFICILNAMTIKAIKFNNTHFNNTIYNYTTILYNNTIFIVMIIIMFIIINVYTRFLCNAFELKGKCFTWLNHMIFIFKRFIFKK